MNIIHKVLFLSVLSLGLVGLTSGMEINVNGTKVVIVKGDILTQDVDADVGAIVNPANTELKHGGGLAAKIRDAAGGQSFQEFCDDLINQKGRLSVGDAILTEGFKLKKKIIHVVGPDTRVAWQNLDKVRLLQEAYVNALRVAQENNVTILLVPSISTGIFGFNIDQAAPVAIETVIDYLKNNDTGITEVRFVMFGQNDFEVYKRFLEKR